MGAIDADAHVLETKLTWEYLQESEKQFTPLIVIQTYGPELKENDNKTSKKLLVSW